MMYTTEEFLAGIIFFNADRFTNLVKSELEADSITVSQDAERKGLNKPNKEKGHVLDICVGTPLLIGKKGEKKYKLTLDIFNEKLFLLKVIDISHGVGYVVVRKLHISRRENQLDLKVNTGKLERTT